MVKIIRIFLTSVITLMYCNLWMGLEFLLYGEVTNRDIDNIMMLLFIPIIYLATAAFERRIIRWLEKSKNKAGKGNYTEKLMKLVENISTAYTLAEALSAEARDYDLVLSEGDMDEAERSNWTKRWRDEFERHASCLDDIAHLLEEVLESEEYILEKEGDVIE